MDVSTEWKILFRKLKFWARNQNSDKNTRKYEREIGKSMILIFSKINRYVISMKIILISV